MALTDRVRWIAHELLQIVGIMWITCLTLLWTLTDTGLLAAASRHMPVAPGGVDRESLNAGDASQILGMLGVVLPVLLILLIAAGALHRPQSRGQV